MPDEYGIPTWNEIPFQPNDTPQHKADDFDAQYAENKDSGDARAEQDPYRRPNPSSK